MSFLLRDRSITIGLISNPAQLTTPAPTNQYFINVSKVTDAGALSNLIFPSPANALTLSGVNKITFNFSADIAVEMGIGMAIIQPWYMKPAEISIVGHSYLGAFPLVQRRDYDVENIYNNMLQSLNEFSSTTAPGNRNRFQLSIANNPANADKFIGYIRKFDFSESVERPYLLDYTIDFVGKPVLNSLIGSGKKDAQNAANVIKTFPGASYVS